ncbi:homeobox protein Hox-B4-like [Penaeus indicus]|uniref:homeobox protein Hox-B4-like n=1 Tax=Penaeus indicus TaxID=29960 RepID=UPI00300CB741
MTARHVLPGITQDLPDRQPPGPPPPPPPPEGRRAAAESREGLFHEPGAFTTSPGPVRTAERRHIGTPSSSRRACSRPQVSVPYDLLLTRLCALEIPQASLDFYFAYSVASLTKQVHYHHHTPPSAITGAL